MDLVEIMSKLGRQRPLFCSEADFQHTLAWELHAEGAQPLLEWPCPVLGKGAHVDILVPSKTGGLAVELKYKTRSLTVPIRGQECSLKDHGAQDQGRYDFLHDLSRMERYAALSGYACWAVLLTNDRRYWDKGCRPGVAYEQFKTGEGQRLEHGSHAWGSTAGPGTKAGGRDAPIEIAGTYCLQWKDYLVLGDGPGLKFRYLLLQAESSSAQPLAQKP